MFVLKKIVSVLFYPMPLFSYIALTGLFLMWFTKKQKAGKIIISVAVVFIILLSNSMISYRIVKLLESAYAPHNLELTPQAGASLESNPIKYIVVLGGGHTSNPELPVTGQIGGDALVRLIEGIRIYKKYPGSRLVLSGGAVFDPVPNAGIMANIARDLEIDERDLLIEDRSRDTADEAVLLKPLLGEAPFILVTSAYHMPRSMALFRKLGMAPIPAPTGHLVKEAPPLIKGIFCPDSYNLYRSKLAIHEYLGIIWSKLRRQI